MTRGRWAALSLLAAAAVLLATIRPGPPPGAEAVLDEILASRDDNDPRLDRDFLGLPDGTKRRFRDKYRALPRERLNERGTIVYLLGRNLTAPEDWAFLREVAAEPPCLSLADCARPSAEPGAAGDDVTLAYPALVAVRQAARAAREGGSKEGARLVLDAARGSRAAAVTRLARTLDAGATAP
ncbi:MAG: hypothetical protein HYV14_11200 [Elusimicrobia bacterium]|nr:hypothetical protein [Elusimicrobiota bacterium]